MTDPAAELMPDDQLLEVTEGTDAAKLEATRERHEERLALMLSPEWSAQLQRAISTLPPAKVVKYYRECFAPGDDRQSLPLVRVSLRKLTQQAIVTNLPRITAAREDITRYLASHWLDHNYDVLEALMDDGAVPDGTSVDVLDVAHSLLADHIPDTEDRSALTTALEQARQHQADCAHWQKEHAAAQLQSARHQKEVEQLTEKLRRAEQRTDTAVRQEREQGDKRLERELRRAQHRIDAAERDLAQLETQVATERSDWRRQMDQLERRSDTAGNERSRELSASLARERADSEKLRARHAAQLRDYHRDLQALRDELAAYTTKAEVPFQEALLDDALIIAYSGIAEEPAQRLTGLFDLYGAFLAGRRTDEHLTRHSNISQFKGRQPAGILLLDLEQLLLDGVNLPLGRYLKVRGLRQEALLHQLINRAQSPRFEGPS